MKKKLLFLLVPILMAATTGCVKYNGKGKNRSKTSNTPTSQESSIAPESSSQGGGQTSNSSYTPTPIPTPIPHSDELPAGTEVKVYLVFGPNGLYKNEAVNNKIEDLFLEHVIELATKVGEHLPTRDDVTSTVEGSKFVAWTCYNNDGKLTEYTKVPGYENKILYASFSGGNGGSYSGGGQGGGGGGDTPVVPPTPGTYEPSSTGALPSTGYGFKFTDNSYMAGTHVGDSDSGHAQYLISNRKFVKDQVFQLYDFANNAGWAVAVDPYSFGGDSGTSTNWQAYIFHDYSSNSYKVLQDFNAESVYIKLKMGEDQLYFALGK